MSFVRELLNDTKAGETTREYPTLSREMKRCVSPT